MVEAVMLWNEPNNLSHWDFHEDPDWKMFARMIIAAAKEVRKLNPELTIALGGLSPVDPNFVKLLGSYGVLDYVDVVAIHGCPLDWNHWSIHDWPRKVDRKSTRLNSSHQIISYAVFCLKKKKNNISNNDREIC